MQFNFHIGSYATLIAVTACGSSPILNPNNLGAPPKSTSGYASASNSIHDTGQTVTDTAEGHSSFTGPTDIQHVTRTLEFRSNGNPNELIMEYSGEEITLTWDAGIGAFRALNSGNFVSAGVKPRFGRSSHLDVYEISFDYNTGTSAGTERFFGYAENGFNTDPATVMARMGTATFTGAGEVQVTGTEGHAIKGFTKGEGIITLNADFDTSLINGSWALQDCACGHKLDMATTVLAFGDASIQGNFISNIGNVQSGDLGLASNSQLILEGQFYGDQGDAIAGTISGTGQSPDGDPMLITGGFRADE